MTMILPGGKRKRLEEIKATLQGEAELKFQRLFLGETGLKVGDIVECTFRISHLKGKRSYSTSIIEKGVLKMTDSGYLYVESTKLLPKTKNVSNGRSGTDYKDWWEQYEENAKSNIMCVI